jgi:hypothetical protein
VGANQEKADANMETNQEMLTRMEAKMDINLKEMKEEMLAKMEARMEDNNEKSEILQNTLVSWMYIHQRSWRPQFTPRSWRKEAMACQETMEVHLKCKELTSQDMECEAEHQEVPKEHATVEIGRGPNKQHSDWHPAKKRTGRNCGSRKKLVTKGTQKG